MSAGMATRDPGPRGHYLAHEAGELAGVSGYTIGQWSRRGYIHASQSLGYPHVYAFQDVAEAMVVHDLIDRGVSLRYIRRALARLRELVGTEWPLQTANLMVPRKTREQHRQTFGRGRTVAVQKADGEILDLVRDHAVLPKSDLVRIADNLQHGGWAARQLRDLEYIEVNPDRLSGQPTIRGRRVAAKQVARMAESGDGRAELRDGFDLSEDEIADASRWWHEVQSYEKAAA